jgi:hypothetical protein
VWSIPAGRSSIDKGPESALSGSSAATSGASGLRRSQTLVGYVGGRNVAAVLILTIGPRVDLAQCCRPDCFVRAGSQWGEPWTKGTLP